MSKIDTALNILNKNREILAELCSPDESSEFNNDFASYIINILRNEKANELAQETDNRMIQQNRAAELKKTMVGKRYRHFKGNLYQIDSIAVHSETSELRVIYHSMDNPDLSWDRNLDMFLSPVDKNKYPDVKQELRFEPVDENVTPTITIPAVSTNTADVTFAVKDEYGNYFAGYNQWNEQVRKAKLYRSKRYAEEICDDSRFSHKKLSIVRVCTAEITE